MDMKRGLEAHLPAREVISLGRPTVAFKRDAVLLLGLSTALDFSGRMLAQEAERSGPEPNISRLVGEGGQTVASLVEQLRRHPAEPSTAAGRVGLYLIGADGGEATLIASEPDPWLNQCGSPVWSPDGKRILFDATPGIADFSLSRIKSLELDEGHLSVKDLGPGNCPSVSPSGDRVIFLLNPGAVPGAESCRLAHERRRHGPAQARRVRPASLVARRPPVPGHRFLQSPAR